MPYQECLCNMSFGIDSSFEICPFYKNNIRCTHFKDIKANDKFLHKLCWHHLLSINFYQDIFNKSIFDKKKSLIVWVVTFLIASVLWLFHHVACCCCNLFSLRFFYGVLLRLYYGPIQWESVVQRQCQKCFCFLLFVQISIYIFVLNLYISFV